MPVMIRGYVDEETWRVLAELSFFFRQICARELDREVVLKLHEQAPELLCHGYVLKLVILSILLL